MLIMAGLFSALFAQRALAQLHAAASREERSEVFAPAYEFSVEHSLIEFRYTGAVRLSAMQLADLQGVGLQDFRSRKARYRSISFAHLRPITGTFPMERNRMSTPFSRMRRLIPAPRRTGHCSGRSNFMPIPHSAELMSSRAWHD